MPSKVFIKFEEVEAEVAEKAPKIVYKYRHWSDPYHQALLAKGHIWFSHPFDLNDPLDIRPELIFDLDEMNRPEYLQKMIASAGMNTPYDNKVRAMNQLELMKENPGMLLENARNYNSEPSHFNTIGVFSTATNILSSHLWNEYSKEHSGFAVGFKTLELCREMKSGFGYMRYCNDPIVFRFLRDKEDDADFLYYKRTKWKVEEEFRFVTVGVGIYVNRLQTCSENSFADVTLGCQISSSDENRIIEVLKSRFGGNLPLYKTILNKERLTREPVKYS
ncbi:MAG: DUF2971 domain-containing protein [Bacteroidetes bacterium]|nr:DUF2971 domain-containing protein [Bacteroidota bacterium]